MVIFQEISIIMFYGITVIVPEDISNTNPDIPVGLTNYPGNIVTATNANNTGSFKIIFYFNK